VDFVAVENHVGLGEEPELGSLSLLLSPDQLPSSPPTSPQEIAAAPAPVCFEGGWPLVADRPDAPAPEKCP
jgi:hypothetical protein